MDFGKLYMDLVGKLMPAEAKKEMELAMMSNEERQEYEERVALNNEVLNKLRFSMEAVDDALIPNKTNIRKISNMVLECRDPQSQIIKDTVGKPPLIGNKEAWADGIRNADVVFTSVVQCHPQLWEKVIDDITPAAYVLVYSLNPQYSQNIEVLKKVSGLLNEFTDMELYDVEEKYSDAMVELYKDLDNPESRPHVELDTSLLKEIGITDEKCGIRVVTGFIYTDTPLPNKRLPSDGLLPFIRFREKDFGTDDNFGYAMRLIPAKYYL